MKNQELTRREVLVISKNTIIVSALTAGVLPLFTPQAVLALDWKEVFQKKYEGGHAEIVGLTGKAFANETSLHLKQQLNNGVHIQVAENSELLLSLPDHSILKITGEAELTLQIDTQGGGVINLILGAMLAVISSSKKKRYLIQTPTATLGVKGTVLFRNVFGAKEKPDSRVPENASDYVCICNGSLDYLTPDAQLIQSDQAHHHSAYFLLPDNKQLTLQKAPFLFRHSDQGINHVIDSMTGKKHDRSWLEL